MTWNLANALFKSLDFVCSFIHFSKVLVFGTISPEALYSTALGLNGLGKDICKSKRETFILGWFSALY